VRSYQVTKPGRIWLTSDSFIARLVLGEQKGLYNLFAAPRSNSSQ
jgi:hypothetical protein